MSYNLWCVSFMEVNVLRHRGEEVEAEEEEDVAEEDVAEEVVAEGEGEDADSRIFSSILPRVRVVSRLY